MENNREMVFMSGYVVHAQHAHYIAKCIKITEVQNILLNFTVILLYFCYNITYVIYLGYGNMV